MNHVKASEILLTGSSPTSSQSWIHVPGAAFGADTSRVVQRRQREVLADQIKQLETRLREKRREKEKAAAMVSERQMALQK